MNILQTWEGSLKSIALIVISCFFVSIRIKHARQSIIVGFIIILIIIIMQVKP